MSLVRSVDTSAADELRYATVEVLDGLSAAAEASGLPAPSPSDLLTRTRASLAENRYRILVVGEAKRGKSSLVNALVGTEALPTNVAVATSQVFRVRAADREAYRLRFEDDSTREIDRTELALHGSQVADDAGERPALDRILRWIEVDLPGARFLPPGVELLDTPGLGALYAAHEQITRRLVPLADAVVFVLDSERPIVRSELDFLETIVRATPDVFVVQTKSDAFGREHVASVRERNESLIAEQQPALAGVRVWPISTTFLLAAGRDDDDAEESLEDSGHAEMEAALRAFLFRVSGWRRAAAALEGASRYRDSSVDVLASRRASAAEVSRAEQERRQHRVAAWRDEFQADWGPRGTRYLGLIADVRRITEAGSTRVRQVLATEGRLVADRRDVIESAATADELRGLNDRLAADLAGAAQDEFVAASADVQERLAELLDPFVAETERPAWSRDTPEAQHLPAGRRVRGGRGMVWEQAKAATRDLTVSSGLGLLVLSVATGGAAALATLGGVIWATVHGWRSAKARQTEAVRAEVLHNYERLVRRLRAQLLEPDPPSRPTSLVETHFADIRTNTIDFVDATVARKQGEAQREYGRMVEDARLEGKEREARLARLDEEIAGWDALGRTVDALDARLADLCGAPDGPTASLPEAG